MPRAAIRPATGDFQMPLLAGRPLYSNSRTAPTLTERTLAAPLPPSSSPSRSTSGGGDSVAAAAERTTTRGGQVLHGPVEVPGGDWIAQARDPQGAAFAMVSAKK